MVQLRQQLLMFVATVFTVQTGGARIAPYEPPIQHDDSLVVASEDSLEYTQYEPSFQNDDSPAVASEGSMDSTTDSSHLIEQRIQKFMSGWQKMNKQDKQTFIEEQNIQELKGVNTEEDDMPAKAYSAKIYDNIDLYSYFSYLYYYPTMQWFLDKTPDTDNYWVGIYKVGDSDKNYLAHQWLQRKAQGSYKIGQLSSKSRSWKRNRYDKFELRLFKGKYKRVDAVTNILHGRVHSLPAEVSSTARAEEADYMPPIEPKLQTFLSALDRVENLNELKKPLMLAQYSQENFNDVWSQFDLNEQQLLLPILKQDSIFPDVKKADPQVYGRLEPKVLYPDLGEHCVPALMQVANPAKEPTKITLTIQLDGSYTCVYPVINTKKTLSGKYSWLGVYRKKETQSFRPKGYLSWQWVGPGYQKTTDLSYIEEDNSGRSYTIYEGLIFDRDNKANMYKQIGFASNIIEATVSATPAESVPKFNPEFNIQQGLQFAYLSKLAYEEYSTVKKNLTEDHDLNADLQIYDRRTDTNGFIASNSTTVIVVFRGTVLQSYKNILTDASFIPKKLIESDSVYCHGGFVDAFNTVYGSIKRYIRSNLRRRELFITGHSLGGALASLLTYRISKEFSESQPTMFVYGCPSVGGKNFSDYFDGLSSYVITNDGDPISTGKLIILGPWVGLFKPLEVYYLQKGAGHGIDQYIAQLKEL